MSDEKYTDLILTYKYSVLLIKNLRENNASLDLLESVVLDYRKNLSLICSSIFLDIILTENNIVIKETDDANTYCLLAIKHYLKFTEVFKHPSEDFKESGKKLLRRIRCVMNIDYGLPSWVYD